MLKAQLSTSNIMNMGERTNDFHLPLFSFLAALVSVLAS